MARKRIQSPRKGTVKYMGVTSNPSKKTARPGRGRPSKLNWPEPPSQSPEEVAEIVLRAKPKEKWRYEDTGEAPRS